jgi:hypothetical protein
MSLMKSEVKPIFVVGMPRSGTTLVQALIGTNTDVFTLPETHVFSSGKKLFRPKPKLLAIIIANYFVYKSLRQAGCRIVRPTIDGDSLVLVVHAELSRMALEREKTFYLEKTPAHLHHIHSIARNLPTGKFIFVTRKLSSCVESYYKLMGAWGHDSEGDIASAISRWFNDAALIELRAREVGGLIVNYDDLIDEKMRDNQIKNIETFLGIKIDASKERLTKVSKEVVKSGEFWKSENITYGLGEKPQIQPNSKIEEKCRDASQAIIERLNR